ncbi:mechanosensitive ion channel [Emticicia sp. CRIBPO]|jgi:hypothetical protein|uniref:mechanosensitive ion channel family protein n=1 Tax=Emticicia sp. CRIBPO TaxID=2683258 RepID=UPI001412FA64|nr:mechanosensitive ion channel [Emticicia sp. CRIBPO]NBA87293.1 mechanosensitive ion channel [Emticicia sp. CRIBPO]
MNKLPNLKEILLETFQKLIEQFSTFTSNLIGSLVIVLIGFLMAKLASLILRNVISKIGLDKIGERLNRIDAVKKFNVEIKLSAIAGNIIYIFIVLFFLVTAADKLGVPAISNMFLMLVNFIPKLISASIMILAGVFLADYIRSFIVSVCKSFNVASGKLIGTGVFFFLLLITVIAALGQAGINTTLLESSFNILVAGVVLAFSIGYGFASKEILLNILSSFYSKNKFHEGQIIEVAGVKGEIMKIDNTTLIIKTENAQTIFPLKILQSEKVIIFDK